MMDHADGNNRLAKIAKVLARAERVAAELALHVLGDAPPSAAERDAIQVVYPAEFDLFTAGDVAGAAGDFQALVANAGALPVTEGLMLSRLMRLCLPGLSDAQYADCDDGDLGYLASRYDWRTDRCPAPALSVGPRRWPSNAIPIVMNRRPDHGQHPDSAGRRTGAKRARRPPAIT